MYIWKGDYVLSRAAAKSDKMLIDKKTMVLIKYSESAKDVESYGNLFEAIGDKKDISKSYLFKSNRFNDKAKSTILSNMKTLMKNITDEWYAIDVQDFAEEEIHCQICNTKNLLIFYIRNKHNGTILHVGSSCIQKYPNIENYKLLLRQNNLAKKEREMDQRSIVFGELEIEDPLFVKSIEEYFENINIMLPYDIYQEKEEKIKEIKLLKNNYIKNNGDFNKVAEKYYRLKHDLIKLTKLSNEFYLLNKDDRLLCSKHLSIWLKEQNYLVWELVAKNNAKLDENTLKSAYNSKYMDEKINEFRKCLVDKCINITRIDGEAIGFQFKDEIYSKPVELYMSNIDFMNYIGSKCLTKEQYTFNRYDLVNIYFKHNINTFYNLKEKFSHIMNNLGFDVIKSEYSDTYHLKLLKFRGNHIQKKYMNYKKIPIDKFLLFSTKAIFLPENEAIKVMDRYYSIASSGQTGWKSDKQIQEEEQFSRDLAINERREFI